jgi:hypothetical protein
LMMSAVPSFTPVMRSIEEQTVVEAVTSSG